MGLDAAVFKNLQSFPPQIRNRLRLVDVRTGELDFIEDVSPEERSENSFVAIDERIGNAATVHWLAQEIQQSSRVGCNVLLSAVFYSGSHGGDVLTAAQIAILEQELDGIDAGGEETGLLSDFVATMRRLIAASREEGNPIVFV